MLDDLLVPFECCTTSLKQFFQYILLIRINMQTITEVASVKQATYPECLKESKSNNLVQALLWLLIAAVLFVIYSRLHDKSSLLGLIQMAIIVFCAIMGIVKLFIGNNKLTYLPTGSVVRKQSYNFNIEMKPDLLLCLEEGNVSRLRALPTDDAGGLLVELLESDDHLFIAARLSKYEPHGYVAKTDWVIMKKL